MNLHFLLLFFFFFLCPQILCQNENKANNSKAESSENNPNIEFIDLNDNDMNSVADEYPNMADTESDAMDYESYPRNNFRPVVPYDYNRFGENPFRSSYAKKMPQMPQFMASDQMETMAMKPMVRPFVPNHIRQHPVYANLYWRKIVYPSTYPSYTGQNSNENVIYTNNLGELQTQESNHMNRRHPHRRYKKRKRLPSGRPLGPMLPAPDLAPLLPIPFQSYPMEPHITNYYKGGGYYPKKRRPLNHNYRPNYFYANDYSPYS